MSSTLTSPALLPTYARYDVTFASGDGVWLTDVEGRRYLDLLGGIAVVSLGHCHPAPLAAAQQPAVCALAHLQPLLDRADAAARRAALRPLRRRAGVLLQLRHRGDRGGAEVGAEGDGQAGRRRARELVPRTNARRARRDRSARQARAVGAARAGRALRRPERRRIARGGCRPGRLGDPDRAGAGRRRDPSRERGVPRRGSLAGRRARRPARLRRGAVRGRPHRQLLRVGAAGSRAGRASCSRRAWRTACRSARSSSPTPRRPAWSPAITRSTFGGNPVVCAAACAVVDTLDDALLASVRQQGETLAAGVADLPGVLEVRGRGLMLGGEARSARRTRRRRLSRGGAARRHRRGHRPAAHAAPDHRR